MRILLFTGKGGVGKTTVAAATAAACAARGERTLVFSTDPAHSLADSLDLPVGAAPTSVATRLSAQQLDARERTEEAWDEIRSYLVEVFDWAGVEGKATCMLLSAQSWRKRSGLALEWSGPCPSKPCGSSRVSPLTRAHLVSPLAMNSSITTWAPLAKSPYWASQMTSACGDSRA